MFISLVNVNPLGSPNTNHVPLLAFVAVAPLKVVRIPFTSIETPAVEIVNPMIAAVLSGTVRPSPTLVLPVPHNVTALVALCPNEK